MTKLVVIQFMADPQQALRSKGQRRRLGLVRGMGYHVDMTSHFSSFCYTFGL